MDEEEVNLWKTKKLLTILREASGNGTSMVSIILRPGESVHKMNQKLTEEYGTATNIKSRVNKQSVMSAITSAQHRLKMYTKCPKNGLVIYAGDVIGVDNKEKKLVLDFEPFRPVNTTMYLCDNKFHIEPLEDLLLDDKTFAFIIVDGNGYLLATVSGNTRTVVDRFEIDLPSKTRRGGQSSNRYARLRDLAKAEYVKKVCERLKTNLVIDDQVNVEGIIVAGNADIKADTLACPLLDPRIKGKIIKPMLDISYGGLQGFNHAINLSRETLGGMKLVEEKKLLETYFESIARDTGMYTFSTKDTMAALESGGIATLIIWENLQIDRCVIEKNGENDVIFLDSSAPYNCGEGEKVVQKAPLIDFLVENHSKHGATIKFVSDNTTEGSQFVKGFGGLGAILRYKMDFTNYDGDDDYLDDDD